MHIWIIGGLIAVLAAVSAARGIRELRTGVGLKRLMTGEFNDSLTATLVASLVVLPRLRAARARGAFNDQLLSGKFDESPVGKEFAAWFAENPDREIQRARFADFALSIGHSRQRVAQRIARCIIHNWKDAGHGFGTLLGRELDKLVFEAPRDAALPAEQQKAVTATMEGLKHDLRELDRLQLRQAPVEA